MDMGRFGDSARSAKWVDLGPQVVEIRSTRRDRDAVVTLLISGEHPVVEHHDDGIRFVIPRVDLLETALPT